MVIRNSARWTVRLLAEHVVERKIVETAHFNAVARALNKTTASRTVDLDISPVSERAVLRNAGSAPTTQTHSRTSIRSWASD